MKELIEALGFVEIESKNQYMYSFWREETQDPRINIYFTKMTVQVQWKDKRQKIYKKVDMIKLEEILNEL